MSDKQEPDSREGWGTIFTPGGEQSLGGVEKGRTATWTEKDEAAYLARVRKKAEEHAAALVASARAEAADIRETARIQGYEQGLEQAR
ncbi:flagellar assembly protein FliH, partial [Desulfovibrio sp. OttesenSCG-928-M14]|nr:flagellar assembly protein FliH [Desulfovibrio sp. OttesenSCG-928-M14]